VRTFIKVLIVCAAVISMPPGLVMLYSTWIQIKIDRFYEDRPILRAMRQAYHGDSSKSDLAADALLKTLPIGTEAAAAIATLSQEGFQCENIALPSARTNSPEAALQKHAEDIRTRLNTPQEVQPEGRRVNCALHAPADVAYTLWMIDLWFAEPDRLIGTKVVIGGISF